tara:strand:- start:215 stop:1075 length:861 start_codon:yes stop_codon:yes gene_type:complete
MNKLKYLIESFIIFFLFLLFKILRYRLASNFGSYLGKSFGPLFRSKKTIYSNIKKAFPNYTENQIKEVVKNMWSNYGRIFAEYIFISHFRNKNLSKNIEIEGIKVIEKIKEKKENVIFVSGHFNNFELMAMEIERSGINLAAIYRPLNNIFINKFMENIRKKYICKHQLKKGVSGVRESLKLFKKGYSIALMLDQRVSEGIRVNFFNEPALTTTIPAQFVKKFKCKIVPIYIERYNKFYFKLKIKEPILFNENEGEENITLKLNKIIEEMIISNPAQWIWSHNRWK